MFVFLTTHLSIDESWGSKQLLTKNIFDNIPFVIFCSSAQLHNVHCIVMSGYVSTVFVINISIDIVLRHSPGKKTAASKNNLLSLSFYPGKLKISDSAVK